MGASLAERADIVDEQDQAPDNQHGAASEVGNPPLIVYS
jgi:hypothetical protein